MDPASSTTPSYPTAIPPNPNIMNRLGDRIPPQNGDHPPSSYHRPPPPPGDYSHHRPPPPPGYYEDPYAYGRGYNDRYGHPDPHYHHRDYRSDRDRVDRHKRHRSRSRDRSDRDRRDRDRHRSSRRSRSRSRSRRDKRPSSRDRSSRNSDRKSSSRNASPIPENVVPIHERPRKLEYWDMPPPGYEKDQVQEAKESGKFPLPCHLLTGNGHAVQTHYGIYRAEIVKPAVGALGAIAVAATVTRQARRLYVSGITPSMSEEMVVAFFNTEYDRRKLPKPEPGDSVVSAYVNHDKAYSFVEFRSEDEARHALLFDGVRFMDTILRVRRPNNYISDKDDPKAASDANKLYVGGIPTNLTAEQVMELLQTFGPLKMFNLITDQTTGSSKGFAFCEYEDPALTDIAIQGLNGMELGPKKLVVQHAAGTSSRGAVGSASLVGNLIGSNVDPASILTESKTNDTPTSVLLLLNVVSNDELLDDSFYEEIISEIKEECSNYGSVESVTIPRPDGPSDPESDSSLPSALVFVKFSSSEESSKAHEELSGREFAERIVLTSYWDEEKFAAGVLTSA